MSQSDKQILIENLERRMRQLGLNPNALVKKMPGVGASAVRDIFTGRSENPSIDVLIKMAEAMDARLGDFLPRSKETAQAPEPRPADPVLEAEAAHGAVIKKLESMSPDALNEFDLDRTIKVMKSVLGQKNAESTAKKNKKESYGDMR